MMFRLNQSTSGRRRSRLVARFARMGTTSAVLACLTMTSGLANAGALLTFYETDGNVQAILTGSLDPGTSSSFLNPSTPRIYSDSGLWLIEYGQSGYNLDKYAISYSASFDFDGVGRKDADTSQGDFFSLWIGNLNFLALDPSYQSGADLNATLTWNNTTFEDLGLKVDESLTVDLSTEDTFTLQVSGGPPPSSASVPAPATPLLIAAGILGGGLSRRLRRTFA